MKKVFLLHTVRPALNIFEGLLLDRYPDLEVRNLMDDALIRNPIQQKYFTSADRSHLLNICQCIESTGAQIIVCTCSSLTPYLDDVRKIVGIPIIAIDSELAENTLFYGKNILLVATAESAIDSAQQQIIAEADHQKIEVKINTLCCERAGEIMRNGSNMQEHDRSILAALEQVHGYDVLVLTQLSTAHLKQSIEDLCHIPTLCTPQLCIAALSKYFE